MFGKTASSVDEMVKCPYYPFVFLFSFSFFSFIFIFSSTFSPFISFSPSLSISHLIHLIHPHHQSTTAWPHRHAPTRTARLSRRPHLLRLCSSTSAAGGISSAGATINSPTGATIDNRRLPHRRPHRILHRRPPAVQLA
jgi:hypothetical protein